MTNTSRTQSQHDIAETLATACELVLLTQLGHQIQESAVTGSDPANKALVKASTAVINNAYVRLRPGLAAVGTQLKGRRAASRLAVSGIVHAMLDTAPAQVRAKLEGIDQNDIVDFAAKSIDAMLRASHPAEGTGQPVMALAKGISCAAAGACIGVGAAMAWTVVGALGAGFGIVYVVTQGCLD